MSWFGLVRFGLVVCVWLVVCVCLWVGCFVCGGFSLFVLVFGVILLGLGVVVWVLCLFGLAVFVWVGFFAWVFCCLFGLAVFMCGVCCLLFGMVGVLLLGE